MVRKKFLGFALVLSLLVAGTAQAAEITARGYWWMEAVSHTNWAFNSYQENAFSIEEKLRTAFVFTANENLRGVLDTQIGTANWGFGIYSVGAGRSPSAVAGSSVAAGSGNIMLRQGFIEYKWPGTLVNIKAGYQVMSLPSAFGGGNPAFDDVVAGLVVSAPITNNVKLLAGYARPADANGAGATGINSSGTATDVVFAAVPVDVPGLNITPFAMYLYSGANAVTANGSISSQLLWGLAGPNSPSAVGVRGYWGGFALTATPDFAPVKIMGDFNYGKTTHDNYLNGTTNGGRSGWMADFAVDYTALSNMTPEFFAAYSTGETGRDTDKSGRMPVVGLPQNWTIGSFYFGERLELAGSINNTAGYTRNTLGYWALGFSLKDMTFIDKLRHTFTVLYARGTNDPDYLNNTGNLTGIRYAGMLTKKDSLWEVDLNSSYKIYDELTLYLNLGYIKSDFDLNVWRNAGGLSATTKSYLNRATSSGDAYKVGLGLNYFF